VSSRLCVCDYGCHIYAIYALILFCKMMLTGYTPQMWPTTTVVFSSQDIHDLVMFLFSSIGTNIIWWFWTLESMLNHQKHDVHISLRLWACCVLCQTNKQKVTLPSGCVLCQTNKRWPYLPSVCSMTAAQSTWLLKGNPMWSSSWSKQNATSMSRTAWVLTLCLPPLL